MKDIIVFTLFTTFTLYLSRIEPWDKSFGTSCRPSSRVRKHRHSSGRPPSRLFSRGVPDDKLVLIQHYSWPCPSLPYTAKTMKRRLSACLEFGVLLLYPETTSLQPGTVSSVSPKQTSGSKTGAVPSAAETHPSSSSPEQTLVLILRVRRVCMRTMQSLDI